MVFTGYITQFNRISIELQENVTLKATIGLIEIRKYTKGVFVVA